MFWKFVLGFVFMGLALTVSAATPQDLLKSYESQSGKASPARGEQFFNAKHGKEWSCASCHENPPNHDTKHIVVKLVDEALRIIEQAKKGTV